MGQKKVGPPPPESKGHLGQKKSTPSVLTPPFPFDHPFHPWHLENSLHFNAYFAPSRLWNIVTWCSFWVNSPLVSGNIEFMLCSSSASRSPPSQAETGNCSDHCNIICDSSPLVSGKIKLSLCRFVPHDRLHHP